MKRGLIVFCSASFMLAITGCNQAASESNTRDADVQAIGDNETQWNKDFEAKDVEKLVAHYADDAMLMSPGTPPATGKEAIRSLLKPMVADNALSLKFRPSRVEISRSGDMAFSQGTYDLTMTDPNTKKPVQGKGAYVTVYRKDSSGAWKAVSDIASSSEPPPAPAQQAKR